MSDSRFFPKSEQNPEDSLASSPDRAKDYKGSDQNRWLAFSAETLKLLDGLLTNLDNITLSSLEADITKTQARTALAETELGKIFIWLASRRFDIAQELKHGEKEGRTSLYGKFRNQGPERGSPQEKIRFGDELVPFQKAEIFKHAYSMIDDALKRSNYQKAEFSEYKFYCPPGCKAPDVHAADLRPSKGMYFLSLYNPFDTPPQSATQTLSHLFLYISHEQTDDKIEITYADDGKVVEDFRIANKFFINCLQAENVNDLLINAGKLSFYLERILPVRLGTSAVIEWLVRGIALHKGYELGPFNLENRIGWDFKALLTPNIDDYAEWYRTSAFTSIKKIDKEEQEVSSKPMPPR